LGIGGTGIVKIIAKGYTNVVKEGWSRGGLWGVARRGTQLGKIA